MKRTLLLISTSTIAVLLIVAGGRTYANILETRTYNARLGTSNDVGIACGSTPLGELRTDISARCAAPQRAQVSKINVTASLILATALGILLYFDVRVLSKPKTKVTK